MNTELKKKVAYDLTMEYIRQHELIKHQNINSNEIFDKFQEIYQNIYKSIQDKSL